MLKGPLGLPRLTNLGPLTEESEQTGELIFRGSNIEDFNSDEFQDNTIDGRSVDIWILDTAAVVQRYNLDTETVTGRHKSRYFSLSADNTEAEQALIDEFRIGPEVTNDFNVDIGEDEIPIKALEDNGLIARKISEEVTGGISSNLGAGIRFAGTGGTDLEQKAPLVMFLEKNRIPARLTKVKYTKDFVNEHPELAGAADSGGRMLMTPSLNSDFTLGNFTSRYGVGPYRGPSSRTPYSMDKISVNEGELVVQWFDDPLSNFKSLEPEQELFAHTNEINLDHALFGICLYTGPRRLDTLYKGVTGTSSSTASTKEKIRVVHNETANKMIANSNRLVVCLSEKLPRTSDKRIGKRKFIMFYDGKRFTDNYNEAIPFTDPRKF